MASPPASTKTSLGQRLRERARQRWPQLAGIDVRFRGQFAYVTGQLPDGGELPLCRLRYVGYASTWGFAIYRASHDDYQDNYLPSGQPSGTPEEALDCACGLYLADPTGWLTPPGTDTPTDLQAGALVKVQGGVDGCGEEGFLRRKQVADPLAQRILVDGDDVVAAHHRLVADAVGRADRDLR
jgi:hypothetical protein